MKPISCLGRLSFVLINVGTMALLLTPLWAALSILAWALLGPKTCAALAVVFSLLTIWVVSKVFSWPNGSADMARGAQAASDMESF